jgi:hypothetical protein
MKAKVLFTALALILVMGCSKDKESHSEDVNLYLIESFSLSKDGHFKIDESSVKTKGAPFISYADFLSYSPATHSFELSKNAIKKIEGMKSELYQVPFAIKVNGTLIYTGYFWASYSSLSCDWLTTDAWRMMGADSLRMELGYPGAWDGVPDRRNDERIIEVFRRDSKLR